MYVGAAKARTIDGLVWREEAKDMCSYCLAGVIDRNIDKLQKRVAGRLHIKCKHFLRVAVCQKHIGADDFCGIAGADFKKLRWPKAEP